ncbi:MAG: glycosyltransferase [Scytonematopsis contorta HA4267-MV1]|jgi:glycosyltransferase involved in cell wall biosynthesis|nr:glycosyltransferase [Scytonematopsis contorta HA4267-MV1]
MAKISIIIPAYNAASTIYDTIVSIQSQTFTDFEIIVINDGSTDKTWEILDSINDSRLKIFSYPNGGLSVARNRGISHATGEFIAFLDADDLWTSDKLELQLAALVQKPEAGFAYSWTYFMSEKEGFVFPGERLFYQGNVYTKLLVKNFIANGSNPLIRKQIIDNVGEFDPGFSHYSDWDYWLRIACDYSFIVVPKYQVFYRQSNNSMSSKVDGIKEEGCTLIERLFYKVPIEYQFLKKQSLSVLLKYCADLYLQHSLDRDGIIKAGQNLWMAISLYPPTLLNQDTIKILIRFLFKLLFPTQVSSYLLRLFRKMRNITQYNFSRRASN